MDAINPFLLLIVVGCGCGLLVLRESPKAAKAFSHWCFQHQAGREGYQKAREEYRKQNGLEISQSPSLDVVSGGRARSGF